MRGDINQTTIGERIRARRKSMDYSQQRIAEQLGVSVSAVSLWEKNKANITSDKLSKLAEILECDTEWLIQGKTSNINDNHAWFTEKYASELKEMWLGIWNKMTPDNNEDMIHLSQMAVTLAPQHLDTLLKAARDLYKQQIWDDMSDEDKDFAINYMMQKNKK
ncbi:helix-turn-helix domain-containing protein [Serratia marcescens]|uniref:helix-turn-helix domain-containing protein n=1 Tax=Serratia marcescens TaxID=615 RepID=UPI00223883F7|nr:helix-turn-helix transcriptional regulator [Serratia marcescens]MCW6024404.1 helix-turn-helix domain-containing protein [Serratia marcescens]